MTSLWPLIDRFPHLAERPRVALRRGITPVERAAERLWVKRDDLSADPIGGNKVRALEFLLGGFARGARVVTAGSRGSTHVLATTIHGRAIGLDVVAASWPQEMNDAAIAADGWLDAHSQRRHFRSPVTAALWLTWQSLRGNSVIPAGGTSPVGILGHVNAAMELAQQVEAGALPRPERVVVPLGTGGTVAGLALGFALAGLETEVVAARVVPRIIANERRIRRLMRAATALIERPPQMRLIFFGAPKVKVVDDAYGGAYGRPLAGAASSLPDGTPLDATYSAKAFHVALDSARSANTLFWLTYDSRWQKT